MAVRWDLRRTGLGRLTESAVQPSRELGAEGAYLLTETADLFFPRFGFKLITRSEVPASVRRFVEFASTCPTGARAMMPALRAL